MQWSTNSPVTADLGGTTLAAARGLAVGKPLGPWTSFYETPNTNWSCTLYNGIYNSDWLNATVRSLLATSGTYTDSNGKTYPVVPTNVPGVGVVMGMSSYLSGSGKDTTYRVIGNSWAYGIGQSPDGGTYSGSIGFGFAFRFVKTGPITPGAISMPGNIAEGAAAAPVAAPRRSQASLTPSCR